MKKLIMKKLIASIMLVIVMVSITGCTAQKEKDYDNFHWYHDISRVTYYDGDDLRIYWDEDSGKDITNIVIPDKNVIKVKNGYQNDGLIWLKVWTNGEGI